MCGGDGRVTCSECHGTYGPHGEFPNHVVPIDEIGTDDRRFRAIYKERRANLSKDDPEGRQKNRRVEIVFDTCK